MTELSEDASHNLRKALDSERRMRLKASPPKLYSTFSDAISARVNVVSTYPGTQYLSREAAKILVARCVKGFLQLEELSTNNKLFALNGVVH